jgi:hypothetical protein
MNKPQPEHENTPLVDSSDTILVVLDGLGDTTERPRPPNIPPYDPRAKPPGQQTQPPNGQP